jgi:hypothetical protein
VKKTMRILQRVPELPGCMGDGKTYEDAIKNTLTVIREWIETASELSGTVHLRLIYSEYFSGSELARMLKRRNPTCIMT